MSQQYDSPTRYFEASAAIAKFARVVFGSAGTISTAGIADKEVGIAQEAAFAAGDRIPVKLRTADGTQKMIASAAITNGAAVYGAASGKIGNSASTAFLIGQAIEAATANNDIIEVIYNAHGDTVVP